MGDSRMLSALFPVLALMTLASAVELVIPLRQQGRFTHGRIPINLALVSFNILVGVMLNAMLLAGALWLGERGI